MTRVALLVNTRFSHGRAKIGQTSQHAFPEPVPEHLGHTAVLDWQQGATWFEQPRQL
jgi:hypothetical protein